MDLDKIDKKILYELSKDGRLSYKQIAQKIHSKKDTVAYRVTQLLKKGLISKFVPVFSLSKLGIFSSKLYIKLQGLTDKDEKKLLKSLVDNPDIAWVAKAFGQWDLFIGMYTTDIVDFAKKKRKILSEFSEFIADYDIAQIEDAMIFNRDYLMDTRTDYRAEFVFGGETGGIVLNDIEKKIVHHIKNNGRYVIHELAQQLGVDGRTVQNKIAYLKKIGVLQGVTVFFDITKLGLKLHKLCIYLKDHKHENKNSLIAYLKLNPHTIHLVESLGSWELEVEMETVDLNPVYDYITELKNRFPHLIKRIDLATITDELKLDFFPEWY